MRVLLLVWVDRVQITWARYEEGSGWWKRQKHQRHRRLAASPVNVNIKQYGKNEFIESGVSLFFETSLYLSTLCVGGHVLRGLYRSLGPIRYEPISYGPYGMNQIFLSCIRISKLWDSIVPYFICLIPISFSSFCLRVFYPNHNWGTSCLRDKLWKIMKSNCQLDISYLSRGHIWNYSNGCLFELVWVVSITLFGGNFFANFVFWSI